MACLVKLGSGDLGDPINSLSLLISRRLCGVAAHTRPHSPISFQLLS